MLFSPARAGEPTTSTIRFSNPDRPGTLEIRLARGELQIKGADTAEISVRSQAQPATKTPRRDGLRVLSSSTGFTLTEKDNIVILESAGEPAHGGRSDFALTVPRQTNIVVQSSWAGDVNISDIIGDLEVNCMNGEVRLDGISGGAVVSTMNGKIHATVVQVPENRPLSFTSMNGEVLLRVPAEASANVRLQTHNGSILTDFEEAALVTKAENAAFTTHHGMSPPTAPRGVRSPVLPPEAHEAIREASRAAVEATREAVQAIREAAAAAREGAESARPADAPPPTRRPMSPTPPMTGGKLVTGTLNGGGPEIRVSTMNGDVTLRKLQTKQPAR